MTDRVTISVTVNGVAHREEVEPRLLLADFLRGTLGLTGTHVGCEHGVCGACTVRIDGKAQRSCLTLAVQADGADILTIEGLSEPDGSFGPLQQAFHENFALQCGFCTPGFLLSLSEYLEKNPDPTEDDIKIALSGNICRCTGYHEIINACLDAAKALRERQTQAA